MSRRFGFGSNANQELKYRFWRWQSKSCLFPWSKPGDLLLLTKETRHPPVKAGGRLPRTRETSVATYEVNHASFNDDEVASKEQQVSYSRLFNGSSIGVGDDDPSEGTDDKPTFNS